MTRLIHPSSSLDLAFSKALNEARNLAIIFRKLEDIETKARRRKFYGGWSMAAWRTDLEPSHDLRPIDLRAPISKQTRITANHLVFHTRIPRPSNRHAPSESELLPDVLSFVARSPRLASSTFDVAMTVDLASAQRVRVKLQDWGKILERRSSSTGRFRLPPAVVDGWHIRVEHIVHRFSPIDQPSHPYSLLHRCP
ncbi:hypothetical protein SCHPADRAFT_944300 [Schizopora paradoxa]|uniref:Uncharacterized protein n=1 Tax=Schizopora paradoxa TaxID=27342 RepID=A0A0H2R9U2_9AGAM|nr:hypothetical protein SCHPADRAFT_944300 [Schizopora paradoxa]